MLQRSGWVSSAPFPSAFDGPRIIEKIHFLGHYTFRDKQHPIDLEAILASVNLQ